MQKRTGTMNQSDQKISNEKELREALANPQTRRQAFSELITVYQERIYWQIRKLVINHDDTADVLQNTFMKAWQNIEHFRGDSKISTWLYTIANNESLTFLNKINHEHEMSVDDPNGYLRDQIMSDTYFDGSDAERHLLLAIATLPPKQRQVFNMRYYDEMSYDEMSAILETSVGALKASYHFAVEKITAYMKKVEI